MKYLPHIIIAIFCYGMVGCNNNSSSSSFSLTSQKTSSNNTNYTVMDIGTVAKDKNNVSAIELAPKHNYGFTIEASVKPNTYYNIQLKVQSKYYTVNLATESQWYGWLGTHSPTIMNKEDDWYYLHLLIKTPDTIQTGKLKLYAYNWSGDTSYIDSLKITETNYFPFKDTLPNFVFHPLTYDILNELAFHTKNATEKNYIGLLDESFLQKVYEKHFISKEKYNKELQRRINKSGIASVFKSVKHDAEIVQNPSVNTTPRETFETKLTGFTEKIIYKQGEKITIQLQNTATLKSIQLLLPVDNYKFKKLQDIVITNKNSIDIDTKDLSPNTYCIQLKDATSTFNVPIIINSAKKSKLIVLAPITTWHAYNHYNGKCFYVNTKDDSCVYHLSTQRPLVSCLFDSILVGHDLFIFHNIYKFFYENYACNVYPDYYLEAHPELFTDANTIIFAQHCEYFSTKMFEALAKFSTTKNIISLGGNQAYYKIQFSNNFKNIECRKDGTFLDNTLIPAGTWHTQFSSEAAYWGNAYTDAGYETYCSYKTLNANHWLFENCKIKNGVEFGKQGIDGRGLSGDEMDKVNSNSPKNSIVLAKGTNPNNGGGDLLIIENKNNAILSFGSIACGSGLNKDIVFTQVVKNFMNKKYKPDNEVK